MIFVETDVFTGQVTKLIDDASYMRLQEHLCLYPDSGDLIQGSGGLRKIRWSSKGRGKRGGLRIIYYWWVRTDKISMLLAYPKSEQEDLTASQVKILKSILEEDYER